MSSKYETNVYKITVGPIYKIYNNFFTVNFYEINMYQNNVNINCHLSANNASWLNVISKFDIQYL